MASFGYLTNRFHQSDETKLIIPQSNKEVQLYARYG